jgi:hypothetical protein
MDSRSLAFLLGVPRSGTTLLSHLLDSHPEIASPPEPWLMLAVQAMGAVHPLHPAGSQLIGEAFAQFVEGLDVGRAQAACATALYGEYLRREGKSIFIDKTPRYYQIVDEIGRIFPKAKFIYLKRNPFAVAGSLKASWKFDLLAALADADDELLFDLVLGYRRLNRFAAANPSRVHVCHYDDLVANTEQALRSALVFLGADPQAASTPFAQESLERRRGHLGDHKILETRSIHQDSLWAWRDVLTREEKQAVHDIFSSEEIVALGFGDLLPALEQDGIVDNGAALARVTHARVEGNYRSRQHLIDVSTRGRPDAPKMIAAVRKASRQPDDAIRLLGVKESPLALIERQGAMLKQLEEERAYFLARISELGRISEWIAQEKAARQDLQQELNILSDAAAAEQAAHQKLDQSLNTLLDMAAVERAAQQKLEQMIGHVSEVVQETQKGLFGRLRRYVDGWRR